jgi:dynamin 1-like protein
MDRLIPLVNRVQDALGKFEHDASIPFPRLVVVGAQSSGKSSVLESLVGRDFLPRGSGIVTRRPLILQLEYHAGPDQGFFEHRPNSVFTDFSAIRREIEQETEKVAGKKCEISNEPIKLKIKSAAVVDITLVDLPGLTKVPVGNQPHNISELIRKLVMSYISEQNCVILAVSAGNADIANSDALRIAREVDPLGERTIGVITKLDIMDKGTDALDVLNGSLYPLALGYIGVVCRSQEDIINNKQMSRHFEDERLFFSRHDKYRPLSHKLGTKYLSTTLTSVLRKHILKSLLQFKKRINELIRKSETDLKEYGVSLEGNKDFQGVVLLSIITKFSGVYSKILEGRTASSADRDLNGGAQIRHSLYSKYCKALNALDPFESVTEQDIRTAILNARGVKSTFLIPQEALELLIRVQIKKLEIPSQQAAEDVLELLKSFVHEIEICEYKVYPNLKPMFLHIVEKVLEQCFKPASCFISDVLENEIAFINLDHPKLISAGAARKNAEDEFAGMAKAQAIEESNNRSWFGIGQKPKKAPAVGSEKEMIDMYFTKNIVISYFNLIKKNVGDYVIKAIMTFLVKKSAEKIQTELLAQLYCKEKFDEILFEDPEIPMRRKEIIELVTSLRKASAILDEVRDIEI